MHLLQRIFDWSEVWALLIPMAILLFKKNQATYLKPVIWYVFIAFLINSLADLISEPSLKQHFPKFFHNNTYLYNIHSIIRFGFFSAFFLMLKQPFFTTFKKVIIVVFIVFSLVYFSFEKFNNLEHISADFLSAEAFLLLIFCLLYYLYKLSTDSEKSLNGPDFYVVTGLSIYVVVNFFVFLFYIPMIDADVELADSMWNIHNIGFVILCLFLAKAFNTTDAA